MDGLQIVGLWGSWPYVATFGYTAIGYCLDKAALDERWWLAVSACYLMGMYACIAWTVVFSF